MADKEPKRKLGALGYWPPVQTELPDEAYPKPDAFGADDYSEESYA